MTKIITNKEIGYIRVEGEEVVFQQWHIYPDVIDAIEELKQNYINAVADYEKQKYIVEEIKRILNNQIDYKDFTDIVNEIEDRIKILEK